MLQIDYLVIGAGIAGLSAASRLARHGRTVVCEAEAAPGVHASGRSAAFAHFDMDSALVRALTAASIPLLEEPNARRHSALFVALEQQDQTLDRLAYHYSEWSSQARRLSVSEARELVPVLREDRICGALLDENGRKLDAHSMLETHRKALIKNGGSIACGAPVTGMQHDGTRWIVDTPGTSYAAKTVVNAAGAWVDEIAGLAQVKPIGIRPLRRTVITFDVPIDVSAWPFTKTVGPGFYIEPEGAGRLLACPMDEGTSTPCDAQPEDEDVARAAWEVEQATTLTIPRLASKWAGLRSFTPDRLPIASFDSHAPDFFWLAGQGGFGLQTSPAMALAAEALVTRSAWPGELRAVNVRPEDLSLMRLN